MIASPRSFRVPSKLMSAHFIVISRVVFLVAAIGCLGCSSMIRVTTGNRDYNLTVEDTHDPGAKGPGWASEDAIRVIAPAFELLAARQDQSLLIFFQPRHGLPMTPFMVEERGQDYQFIAQLPSARGVGTIQRVEISAFLIFHLNDILKDASEQMKSENGGGARMLATWIIKNRAFPFEIESLRHGQTWSGSATATDGGLKTLDQIYHVGANTRPEQP